MKGVGREINPNLMPDEQIVYRTRAGKFSFSRYLPASTVIATNKRLLVYRPIRLFSKHKTYFYDRIESVSVRKGLLASTFVISTELGGSNGKEILFYNASKLLSVFGIVSNQIRSSRDPHYGEKIRAHSLDTRYAVLKSTQQFAAPDKKSEAQLSGLIRPVVEEQVARIPLQEIPRPLVDVAEQKPVKMPDAPKPKLLISVNSVLSITQKLQKYFNSSALQPQRVEVGYYAAGDDLFKPESLIEGAEPAGVAELQKGRKPKTGRKFNPDTELQIFRIRKLRASKVSGTSVNEQLPYQFSLFNLK